MAVNAGFDGGDFHALLAQAADERGGFRVMFPTDGFLGAEGGLRDARVRGPGGDSRQIEFVASGGVDGAEERADVIEAAHVMEQYGNWNRMQALVRGGGSRRQIRDALEFVSRSQSRRIDFRR